MRTSLIDFLPAVLRVSLRNSSNDLSQVLEVAESLLRRAQAKSLADLEQYLSTTNDVSVLQQYLAAIGIELPLDQPEIIRRAYVCHRDYLAKRETVQGLKLLGWMISGESPQIEETFSPETPLCLGQAGPLGEGRLRSPVQRYLQLTFAQPLDSTKKALLKQMIKYDQPLATRVLISEEKGEEKRVGKAA